jgi:hypothetical protein
MSKGQDRDEAATALQFDGVQVVLATPRKLPKAATLEGGVVVVDIAFASESGGRRKGFERTTKRFIDALDERLVAWVDHHDSEHHAHYADDPRFVLATKRQHGACPEMITPQLVARFARPDTLVCHTDFDGLASAAKWILGGTSPYPACDADARAIDTRIGLPGPTGERFDRAIRARPRSQPLLAAVLGQLVGGMTDAEAWRLIDEAGDELRPREDRARSLADGFAPLCGDAVWVDASKADGGYDKTLLLLLGQQRATIALVLDGDTATFAAPFDSGVNFLERFGLSGGMPTLVSVHRAKLCDALVALDVEPGLRERLAAEAQPSAI